MNQPNDQLILLSGRNAAPARGFSLVELMVALLLGSIVTLGIIQMFTTSQRSNMTLEGQARLQESARFGIEFLLRPLRGAGFLGCASNRVDVNNVLDVPNVAAIPFEANIINGLAGFEAISDTSWSPALTTLPAAFDPDVVAPNTDVLVVRRVNRGAGVQVTTAQVNTSSNLETEIPADPSLFDAGSFALVSDCNKATLFQITGATSAADYTMQHAASGGPPGNAVTALNDSNEVFGLDATVYPITTTVFFIGDGAGINNRLQTPLSLWSWTDGTTLQELIEGVEDLQLLYGLDTDGDGAPNRYRTIQNVTDPGDVVTVRVSLTTNSVNVVSDTGDGLMRRTFTSTVAVRNRMRVGS